MYASVAVLKSLLPNNIVFAFSVSVSQKEGTNLGLGWIHTACRQVAYLGGCIGPCSLFCNLIV